MEIQITLTEIIVISLILLIFRIIFLYYKLRMETAMINDDFIKKADQLNKNLGRFNRKAEQEKITKENYIG